MTQPSVTLDSRFSDPHAASIDWQSTVAILEAAQLSWITTVRADGRPHVTPLVSVWLDNAAHFTTGPAEQKAINLAHNPFVAITTGCNTWDHGVDIVIEGAATRVTDTPTLHRLAEAWRSKWTGQWQFEVGKDVFTHEGGQALVFRVVPDKILAFGKDPFSQTRYRFAR